MNKDPDVRDCLSRRAEYCGVLKGKLSSLKALIAQASEDSEQSIISMIEEVTVSQDKHNLIMKELKSLCEKRSLNPAEFEESAFTLNTEVGRQVWNARRLMFEVRQNKLSSEREEEDPFETTVISGQLLTGSADDRPGESESQIEALRREVRSLQMRSRDLESTREHVAILQTELDKQYEDHEEETSYYRQNADRLRHDLQTQSVDRGASTPTKGTAPVPSFGDYTRVGLGQEELFAISNMVGKTQADVMKYMIDESHVQQKELYTQQKQFYNRIHTPQVELKQFDGDLTKYQSFMSRYDDLVGDTDSPYSVKLNTLLQSCNKSVQRHLGCCEHGPPRDGYEMARKILKTKYGKPYLVANAWIEKVMNYPKLSSPDSVSTFASELRSAKETLDTMGYLSELDNTDKRRLIVSKLPAFVQHRWRKIHREANDKGRKCTINQLVDLITQAGDEMDDPIYGAESLSKLADAYTVKKPYTKKKGLASNAYEQAAEPPETAMKPVGSAAAGKKDRKFGGEPCGLCQGEHFTRRCAEFENMGPAERAQLIKDKNMCVMCLSTRHILKDCRFDWVCQVKGCKAKHNTTLHAALTSVAPAKTAGGAASSRMITFNPVKDERPERDKPLKSLITRQYTADKLELYALPTVPVLVCGPGFEVATNMMLDTGGGFTCITERLQRKAHLVGHKEVVFSMGTLTSDEDVASEFVTFEVKGLLDDTKYAVLNASVMDRNLVDSDSVDALRDLSTWPHLRRLRLPLHDTSDIDIILGQDNAHLLRLDERCQDTTWRGPRANMTPLGWAVFGLNMGLVDVKSRDIMHVNRKQDDRLCQAVEKMWALDEVPQPPIHSPENQEILNLWNKEAKIVDGHVQLPLPIKGGKLNLPNNAESVLKRHATFEKRLLKNDNLRTKVVAEMKKNFDLGYAEDALDDATVGSEWYHPIQSVTSDKKPGKCRLVGDLSCTHHGRCLNDDIAQGPNFTVHIAQVMIKFRRYKIAVVGDIEKMYNQVRVPPEQRDCLRFFWWVNDVPGSELKKCRMTTQMFGGIWSASAAMFALVWLANHFSEEYSRRVIETVLDHFYVDDMLDSLVDELKTITWLGDVRSLLQRGSFNLTKIGSNSQAVLESIPVEARAPAYADISFDKGEDIVDQTVGSVWRPLEDTLSFRTIKIDRPRTRRGVLSVMSSLYDPLGLVAPYVLLARILLQEICRSGYEWDEVLSEALQDRWEMWLEGLTHIREFRVPRWLGMTDDPNKRYQIHVFSDASEAGYGAALYLLIKNVEGDVRLTRLLCSKAKVTPVKPVTIPRLELCAAVVAVKIEEQMKRYLDVPLEPSVFWCDSQIVINYLRGEAWQYKTFVSHRVLYIQEHSEVEQWRHVPGEMNVADKASRGMSGKEMLESTEWVDGPSFLYRPQDWPRVDSMEIDRSQLEVRKRVIFKYVVHRDPEGESVRKVLLERYSSWCKMIRQMAAWLRIVNYLRKGKGGVFSRVFTALEMEAAETRLIQLAQIEYITTEQRKSRIFEKLFPYSEDGMLRVGGRLMKATLTYEEKYPPIMPRCNLQETYIRHVHVKCGHGGIDRTYNEARQRYWLLGGKVPVKVVVQKCKMCRQIRGAFGEQVMAPLPKHRVAEGRAPFERIGIDYFGPVHVKINRTTQKRWICMIVCLATRAVHIEPSHDLSTASFLNVFQRFVSRRGRPALVVSDNGTNFVGAKRELKEALDAWNQEHIGRYMSENGIEWRFNTPTASHHGGVWERLIRSARNLIMALTKDQLLNDDKLNTLTCSVEQIMNSRPLTAASDQPGEPLPITPNHLLNLRKAEGIEGSYELGDTIDKKWKQVQYLADIFWKRWTGEYLRSLQLRSKWKKPKKDFAVGDVVLVLQEGMPRLKWPVGRIIEALVGIDGHVRSVKVKTQNGQYLRPITKLVQLECD